MNDLVLIITLSILIMSIFIYYESKYYELTYVTSNIDNRKYLVRKRDDSVDAADILATIRLKLLKLRDHLNDNYGDKENVKRLVKNFNPDKISESISTSRNTSYSVNKGEKIIFCIRSKKKTQKLVNINTMMFVAIHEMAHIMTKSFGHTEEFWDNMRYLLKIGIKINIYKKRDYRKKPVPYCGIQITDSPL